MFDRLGVLNTFLSEDNFEFIIVISWPNPIVSSGSYEYAYTIKDGFSIEELKNSKSFMI